MGQKDLWLESLFQNVKFCFEISKVFFLFQTLSASSVAGLLDAKKLRQAMDLYESRAEDRGNSTGTNFDAGIEAVRLQIEVDALKQRIEVVKTDNHKN